MLVDPIWKNANNELETVGTIVRCSKNRRVYLQLVKSLLFFSGKLLFFFRFDGIAIVIEYVNYTINFKGVSNSLYCD